MNVSKKQKAKTRKAIIKAAVDVISIKGIDKASMREISKKAKIADATIYKYFPTKNSILFSYFEDKQSEAIKLTSKIDGFSSFNLQEKFQTYIETHLELFLPDREFVEKAFEYVFKSSMTSYKHIGKMRDQFILQTEDFLKHAETEKEIPEQPFLMNVATLSWDYYLGVLLYWLRDESELFVNTTQFIDKSLDIIYSFLLNGMMTKVTDFTSFLFKAHFFRYIEAAHEKKNNSKVRNTMKWVKEKIDNELEGNNAEL